MLNTDYFSFSVHHLVEGGNKVPAARADIKSSRIRLQDILEPFLQVKIIKSQSTLRLKNQVSNITRQKACI